MGKVRRVALLLSLFSTLVAPMALAHPQHSSNAELGWSADGARLEVSLALIPEDLEVALSERAGHPVILEQLPDSHLEEKNFNTALLLDAWLAEHFQVVGTSGAPAIPRLEGMEVSYKEAWLFFTLEASREQALSLRNTILLDINPGQTNRVGRLWSPAGETLLFDQNRVERPIWP